MNYDKILGEYTIEFNTLASCPMQIIEGIDCIVHNPLTEHTYDLTPLRAKHFYTVPVGNYEFELNVCGPIHNGSCPGTDVAACQKELDGEKRLFSLGKSSTAINYFNAMLNLTFVGGTPYRDEAKTPRKSHIAFICDPTSGNGHPEYDGEKNQTYFFRW